MFGKAKNDPGLFDINGDGRTDWTEELMAFALFDELKKRRTTACISIT